MTNNDIGLDESKLHEYISSGDEDDYDVETYLERHPEEIERLSSLVGEIPTVENKIPNVIIVTGLPTTERVEKFKAALLNRISKILLSEELISPDHIIEAQLPVAWSEKREQCRTIGVCFLKFPEDIDTVAVVEALEYLSIDNKTIQNVCLIDDVKSKINIPENCVLRKIDLFPTNKFRDWLKDSLGREQFGYRCGVDTEVMWFDAISRQPEVVCKKNERFGFAFCWSPMGSYFLTIHKRGVWIRANNTFEKLMCFLHKGAKHVLFSPNEKYLITYDGTHRTPTKREPMITVWECCTGRALARLCPPPYSPSGTRPEEENSWPFFLFSADSKYIAARGENHLTIYETATMTLLSNQTNESQHSMKQTLFNYQLEQFQWSPSENYISIWVPELGDTPGRLLIVDVASQQEIASKNVFSVKSITMHWHECGEFLALNTVIVRRLHKKMKKDVTQIEIFRVKEKSVPVDIVDLEGFRVWCLHWEKGLGATRFATLTTDEATSQRKIDFFDVPGRNAKQDTKLVQSLSVTSMINSFSWSPAGQYFVAVSKGGEGHLIFGVLNEHNKAEIIQKDEHMDLTDVMWDPSGRYVTTAVLAPPGFRFCPNSGFHIYSFLGRLLYRFEHEECAQFLWRPRPPLMLSRAKLDEIYRSLKEYSKRFDTQDEVRRQARQDILKQEGTDQLTKFLQVFKKGYEFVKNHPLAATWQESLKDFDKKMDWDEQVTTWEEIVEITRESVKKPT